MKFSVTVDFGIAVAGVVPTFGSTRREAAARHTLVSIPFPEVDSVHVIQSDEYAS